MDLLTHFFWASPTHLLLFYLLLFSWVYYFIPWASLAHLLLLYHLLFFVGLLTIIPAVLACWSLHYYFLFQSSLYCWAFSTIRPFVKSGYQHFASFLNIGPHLISFLVMNKAISSNSPIEQLFRNTTSASLI